MLYFNSYCRFYLFRITFKTICLVCGALALLSSCSKHGSGDGDDTSSQQDEPSDAAPEQEPELFAPHSAQAVFEALGTESFSGEPFSLRAILEKQPLSNFRGNASGIELSYSISSYGAPPRSLNIRQEIGTWEVPAPTVVQEGRDMQLALTFESPDNADGRFSSYSFVFRLHITSVSDTRIRGYLESPMYVASENRASYLLLPAGTEIRIIRK